MSTSDTTQRSRGPSNGVPSARPGHDQRNVSTMSSTSGFSQPAYPNGSNSGAQMSRAEKFEDEKKRIIQSCFGKKEPDGASEAPNILIRGVEIDIPLVSESYITHIRIDEDAAFPSSPPPRDSPPDKKKARVIIVAVRKSGRVRMHKAKENANGTFSIGKTWVLDDLTVIQSFTNAVPQNAEEQQDKQRAGPTGFIVTVQKPYYWNAHTAKEKDFFIFSLIKIFKKYTGGRLPTLMGFSSAELEQLGGASGGQNGTPPVPPGLTVGSSARVSSQEQPGARETRPLNVPPETSRERRLRPSQERSSQERPPQRPPQDRPSQERQLHSTVSHPSRPANSSDRIHMPGSFPSTDSVNDTNQQPQLRTKRSESPAVLQQPSFRRPGPVESTESFRSGQESFDSARSSNERPRPKVSYSSSSLTANAVDDRSLTAVKDLRGPSPLSQQQGSFDPPAKSNLDARPVDKSETQTTARGSEDKRNGHRRDHSTSSKSSNRGARGPPSSHRSDSNGDLVVEPRPTPIPSHDTQTLEAIPQTTANSAPAVKSDALSTPNPQPNTPKFPPTPPPDTPTEEVHRPGLGPMIRTKKSTTEVASKFRKAATAYNAFKPRAGGAAEKIKDDNAGDGITGVFLAPSLLRAATQEDSRPSTPKENVDTRPSTPETKKEVPPVTVTTSPPKQIAPTPPEAPIQESVEPLKPPPIPDKAHEERHQKRRSDHSAKYAKLLGINPSLLEGRTSEMEAVLNDFGWEEERNQKAAFEDLESGIRKELARVEAGSWLSAVENNDDRALAVGDMMDRVIAECEELDCLMTLYNVELGVS